MNRSSTIATTVAALAFGIGLAAAAQAQSQTAAPIASNCAQTYSQLRARLDRKIMPSFMMERYRNALTAAYEGCRTHQTSPWDRVARIVG